MTMMRDVEENLSLMLQRDYMVVSGSQGLCHATRSKITVGSRNGHFRTD